MWYVSGAIMGISNAFISVVPMTIIINNWFVERKGLAISLAWVVYDIVVAVGSPIFSNLIVSFGWRKAYLIGAIAMAVFVIPCTFFFVNGFTPEQRGLKALWS